MRTPLLGFSVVLVHLSACGGSHRASPVAATITITQPAADLVAAPGTTVNIAAVVVNFTPGLTLDFFADVDGDLTTVADQVLIAGGHAVPADGAVVTPWDTTGVASNSYAILARRTAGDELPARALGRVIVNVPPNLTIVRPAIDTTVSRAGFAAVSYADTDPDNDAWTQFFADVDGNLATTGDQHPLTDVRPEQNGAAQEVMRELTGVPEAEYHVVGVTADAVHEPVVVRAAGKLRVANTAWAKRAGGIDPDTAAGVAAVAHGACVVTGMFHGTATFGAGEPNEVTLVSPGGPDVFVARYASDGALTWARRAGGLAADEGVAIAALADGSCMVTGYFQGIATFGAGEPNVTNLISAGGDDMFIARYASDGSFLWAKRAGGSQYDHGRGISAQADGSCVMTGYFQGVATFGAGEPNVTNLVSAGGNDIFIARYASDGSFLWARRAGGSQHDHGWGISAQADSSCVMTGSFQGTATFGAGEPHQATLVSAGGDDIFVARYASDGSLLWAKRAGGTLWEMGRAISALVDGTCALTGRFEGRATFGAGEANETTLVAAGYTEGEVSDIFVARYASDGSLLWAKRAGGLQDEAGEAVSALADGSCVVSGWFWGSPTFGPGEPNQITLTTVGASDLFVARYAKDGSLAWARRAGGTDYERAVGVAAVSDGSCAVCGLFQGTATFGAGDPKETNLATRGGADVFVARFNADGRF